MTWSFPLCPNAPDWLVDWEAVEGFFPELLSLASCAQDPRWHGEGDVLTHVRMVVDELVDLEDWQALTLEDRSVVFLAALFHDIAKPQTSSLEGERIRTIGHARKGAMASRWLIDQRLRAHGFPISFAHREQVVNLILKHALPTHVLEKDSPERAVITTSQYLRNDLLALLAEADMRGRVCDDQRELIEKVEMFRVLCEEAKCLTMARQFASDHTRFRYFHSGKPNPDLELFDETVCEVILMAGLPGAGKDTWIEEHGPAWPVVSLDNIREELRVSPTANQGRVVQVANERAREHLRRGESFIWNATNITKQLRQIPINLFTRYKARTRIVFVETYLDLALERNAERRRRVPPHVICKFADRLEVPDLTEAQQVEYVIQH